MKTSFAFLWPEIHWELKQKKKIHLKTKEELKNWWIFSFLMISLCLSLSERRIEFELNLRDINRERENNN